ncbi:selenocysteine-specific translation elongation factor [Geobacter sp. SVR]|uniref:selenocysteine-specific translation elongation factor n=1 Tax=Geobacter sp. SVR TaxID=2495594 RepID=UPI00143F03FC|nr:selenocysteine-specific translation elongation factor [Geobacter sp. SVR]BCS55689.1 selenocysteine-specific translation factor [Geobacter sp. SVR]GCF83693.1 selenocysteine-specific translation factor [Geobacter sp. SVR]
MKHLILGTAGHIDHGKTSLVKALTGTDTDRLKEEKARGITIELGFAHLQLPGGVRFGIVDVPGHEKFVRTMVAGVGGMDLVMLVIAADEGIMPQTREHLDILRLLGVKSGLVALTKRDMVDNDWLELVTEEVREFVAGTFLEQAPICAVSSKTGEGLDWLREELERLAGEVAEKRREGHFRLPVDRVFTMPGFGTVVTGTLLAGEITVGDELELLPGERQGRVRGIQAHGTSTDKGLAGQRLAVNLQGIDLSEAHRGDVVVPRETFRATRAVDVRLDYLSSAPRPLKHRSTVRLHSATYEVPAQVILLDRDALQPGESAYAQLRLKEPALLLSGDSYILRAFSPQVTVGGGITLDPFPPHRRRRSADALALLEALDTAEHQRTLGLIIGQSLLSGIGHDELLLRAGISRKVAEAALSALLGSGEAIQVIREPRIFLAREAFDTLKKGLLEEVAAFLSANPLKAGMGKEELKTRLPRRSDPRFFTPLLAALERDGTVVSDREIVKPAGRTIGAAIATDGLAARIAAFLQEKGIEPPTIKEIMERFRCDEKSVRDNLALLTRNNDAVRISGDLFYATAALDGLREKLVALLKDKGEITPPEYRDVTGLSRKFLIPLLEHFDGEKVTIRVGDKRMLRKR